jgi:hypothetical protein
MQDRVSDLADGRRMVRLTSDEVALLKMICLIKKDPPWDWTNAQTFKTTEKLKNFAARKKPCRMIDFLQHYNLRSLIPDISYSSDGALVAVPPTPIDVLVDRLYSCCDDISQNKLIVFM